MRTDLLGVALVAMALAAVLFSVNVRIISTRWAKVCSWWLAWAAIALAAATVGRLAVDAWTAS